MTRFRQVFLLVMTLTVSASAATNDLDIARQALRDGLWEVARAHAGKVPSDAARLVILESLAGEGKWEAVGKALEEWKDSRGDGFDYYRAVVKGDLAAAMALLRKGGSSEGVVQASLFEAGELARRGKRADAEKIWRELSAMTNVGVRVFATVSVNLGDVALLRRAYAQTDSADLRQLRRQVGLGLGVALLREAKTVEEGEKLVLKVVNDSPDTPGAREALLSVAEAAVSGDQWQHAFDTYHKAIETWPDVAHRPAVQESRGWVLRKLGRMDEALEAFRQFGALATTDEEKATALAKEGDVLQAMGREDESMAVYRRVLEKYPKSIVAGGLKNIVFVRDLEARGRDHYGHFRFEEAMEAFSAVAKADAARKPTMDFFAALCQYGLGNDDSAIVGIRRIAAESPDAQIRLEAKLWLAKILYNRREWKESGEFFLAFSEGQTDRERAAEALLWAARAAFASSDFARAIQLSTLVADRYPASRAMSPALLVQGESLVELVRLDEAVLVFERVIRTAGLSPEDRIRAQTLKADALYAMGADNPSRYASALATYREVLMDGKLSASSHVVLSFKVARVLEKLKRMDEAVDIYYSQVVLAFRDGRAANAWLTDDARAAFSRAAFRLADVYEGRGRVRQAVSVLRLVAESGVAASDEAVRRIGRLSEERRVQ